MSGPTPKGLNHARPLILVGAAAWLLAFSDCALIPQSAVRVSHRDYCREAARMGWCSPACGKRQPALCRPLRLLSCSDWMCTWRAADGSLVFSADLDAFADSLGSGCPGGAL